MAEFVASGIEDVSSGLDAFGKTVFRRAAADALTDIAFSIKSAEEQEVSKTFDGTVAFTKRGFRVTRASFKKDPVESRVFILPQQSEYLRYQIFGGTRTIGDYAVTGGGVLTPVSARLTKAGNIPSGPKRYLGKAGEGTRKQEFVGIPKGDRFSSAPFGIWKRLGREGRSKLRLLAAFNTKASYAAENFDFFGVAGREFDSDFIKLFQDRISNEVSKLKGWR